MTPMWRRTTPSASSDVSVLTWPMKTAILERPSLFTTTSAKATVEVSDVILFCCQCCNLGRFLGMSVYLISNIPGGYQGDMYLLLKLIVGVYF